MSGAAVMDAIGVISGVLGIIGFFQDNIPGNPPPDGAIVKVKGGNPGDDDPGLAGDVQAAYTWDIANNYHGQSDGGYVEIGDAVEFTIDSFSAGSRADFAGISVADNALCVAWITVTQKDKTDPGAWTGDIGSFCDQHWFMQIEPAGRMKDSDNVYVPRCTWFDADHTGDVEGQPPTNAAMKFRILAYGKEVVETVANNKACEATLWGYDNAPINGEPGGNPARARSVNRPRKPYMEETLIISPNITSHKAADLCNSIMSWGPDFVGSDGHYCDMGTHTLFPLCSTANVDGCVDVDPNSKAITRRSVGPKRAGTHSHKAYNKVKHWG